ncbi:MAG: calcium-binding protein [Nitrospiraceae bacterium]
MLAERFISKYDILDHHANDSTGFSATLMRDTTTGEYTLSFRSTEFRDESLGGDYNRDAVKADGDIAVHGFAFAQLLAMEEYFARLKQGITSDGTFDAGLHAFFGNPTHQFNVTGYSLGGHLATVFTELHESEVRQTYLFNASGRGSLPGAVPGLAAEEQRIADILAYFRRVIDNPDEALPSIVRGQNYQDAVTAWTNGPTWDPFDQGTATLYDDPRYQWAQAATLDAFDPIGTATIEITTGFQGEPQTTGAFAKMTALYGQAASGDLEVVANSGVHRAGQAVFIEGQPLLENALGILPFGKQVGFGNTHAITLLVDSLSLQELFLTLDPQLQQTKIEALIRSSSNAKSDLVALTTASHAAEGDSLEKALEGLRKLFLPSPLAPATLNFDDAPGGFGNLTNRNDFYAAIAAVKTAHAGATVTIESFVELNAQGAAVIRLTPNDVVSEAQQDTDRGQAFRYALKSLNPFAVVDADYQGLGHASNDALTLFDPATGFGELTDQYLIDRTAFLGKKIELNLLNDAKSSGNIHFKDFAPNGLEITTVVDLRVDQEFLFGSDGDEGIGVLVGRSKADHLYGGGGNDLLESGDGRDYLQGDAGIDRLDGGEEADTMAGGADSDFYIVDNLGDQVIEGLNNGTDRVESSESFTLGANVEHLTLTGTADLNGIGNALNNDITGNGGINRLDGKGGTDHLVGGDKNDILLGGTGDNDLLEGGEGFDTYYYNAGDGIDQIEDSDATGKIVFNGGLLQGGISTVGGSTYVSLDGSETYVLSGGHLIVNGVLTVNADFQSGQFGIQLDDLSDLPTNTGPPTGPFLGEFIGTENGETLGRLTGNGGLGDAIYGLGGNDALYGLLIENDLLDGGSGDDVLVGFDGNDYLDGGVGDDYLYAGVGKDVLIGGTGNDFLNGDVNVAGTDDRDYLDGGEGADSLWGGWGTDVLLGRDGDDILRGDNRPDGWPTNTVLTGTEGDFIPFPGPALFSATGAADFLDGGSGNDLLVGDGGDDILSGGAGNDRLFGDDEAGYQMVPGDDVLDGGAGDDLLAAGDGADSLSGGAGLDQLFGDKGNDVLDGGDDADTLHGSDGADQIFGGAGDDLIFGDGLNNLIDLSAAGGVDFLDGGAGNDQLEGGVGDDTLFGGTENDVLFGEEGADSIFGDEGADELQGGLGNDLLSGDAGDDRLFGQDGADALSGDEGNDGLAGNDGNDLLYGGVGNDILEGGKGSDILVGGAGHDAYNFSLGDGQDTITDTALAGEGNLIQFFSGITLDSLSFVHDSVQQALTIQVGAGDSIRLVGFDPNALNYVVDTLDFADGTVVALADQLPLPGGLIEGTDNNNVIRTGSTDDTIYAGAGNDRIETGAGNDVLVGGTGNDVLHGGAGQDTYRFNPGDGTDIVSDAPGEGNRLVFGPGVSTNSVTLGLGTGDSLSVHTGVAGDAIRIRGSLEGGDSPSIDALEFADGTTLSIGELLVRGIEIIGTAGPDTLSGTNLIDRISGGAGNDFIVGGLGSDILRGEEGSDQLFGGDGDDRLDGGAGADVLWGETGQDTYVFGRGYGQDIVRDSPVEQSGPNTIQLTSDVIPADVRLQARRSKNGIDVVLTINGTQDELSLLGAADPGLLPISQILFTNGTSWDTAEILSRIEGLRVTAAPDGSFLEGTGFRDELIGAQSNDDLDGLGGADRMVGGAGDDHYWVNDAGDTVVELDGEGTDTVLSQIDYTLPEHVENLFLRSTNLPTTDPVRGEGNASDNLLLGNFVNNVLIGGPGNDIFLGGFSIGSDYGAGDDDLYGGAGNDTYVVEGDFNGFDTVHDVALPGEGNRLQFGNSVRPDDVVFVHDGSTLRITNGGGAHGAVLENFDSSGTTGSLVAEVVAFSSGVEDVTGG